jgi:DNA-binding transcriptional LysR family regulator
MKRIRPFDTRQLEAFATLSRKGSYTLAAKDLFVTQSAISHSIKSLEQEAGCKLIQKLGKKVTVTQAGSRLLEFVEPWLTEMDQVRREINGWEHFGSETIRLGASDQICRFLLPALLSEFSKVQPKCKFEIRGLDTADCLNLIGSGEIDLALTVEPLREGEFQFIPCFSDELVAVVSPSHDWAKKGMPDWVNVTKERLILPNRNGYTFRALREYLSKDKISVSSYMEMNSSEATKALIKERVGIGVMADWFVAEESRSGELVALPFGPKRLIRTWGVSLPCSKPISATEKNFVDCVQRLGCHWMVNRDPALC